MTNPELPEVDYTNVLFLDEGRKDRVMRQLNIARQQGRVAVFNAELDEPAKVIPFPRRPDTPDDAA